MAFSPQRVDLSELASETIEVLKSVEPQRQVEVKISPQLVAKGDKHLLHPVIANLLGNAWKYTRHTDPAST